ncbi:GNAT family N-acetyltransferase [Halorarius litoreus]|uniref:GNAT family N-acetyltransferase n=1 Tax=Halorarius litoreus TaxID=2962676 RepID=UPI0020CFCF8C|nr:GNAT family protein [Halorarius litoreus]
MPGPVFLEGDRLTLRTVEPEDVPFLHRWSNDPAMRRATGEQNVPLTLAQEEANYQEFVADDTQVVLLVCRETTPVGAVELLELDHEADAFELAYWLVPDAREAGYAREAVSLLLEYAFDELAAHRIHAEVFAFNDHSAAFLARLGFTEEGRLRESHFADGERCDTLVFGLLEPEWQHERR